MAAKPAPSVSSKLRSVIGDLRWSKSRATEPRTLTGDQGVVVLARPPIVYLVSIVLAVGLNLLWPAEVLPHAVAWLGGLVILLAIVLFVLSFREFRRVATPIRTRRSVTALIRTGPYRLSRNPIYLSFTLLELGIGILVNSAWVLGMLIPTVAFISYGVIAREEEYMAARFGEEYRGYKTDVRRWI